MAQTTITANPSSGLEGALASTLDYQVVSRVAAEAIPVGSFVVLTATDQDTCELPDAAGEAPSGRGLGVALRHQARESADYAAGDQVDILTQGEVWVVAEDAVTAGGGAFVRHTSGGGGTRLGGFRSDADTATADAMASVTFTRDASAAALTVVKLGGSVHS